MDWILKRRSMAGSIGSLGNVRGWICLGSGHRFAKGNSRRRGTGKVRISTRQAARLPFPPVSLPPRSQRIIIHGASNDIRTTKRYTVTLSEAWVPANAGPVQSPCTLRVNAACRLLQLRSLHLQHEHLEKSGMYGHRRMERSQECSHCCAL